MSAEPTTAIIERRIRSRFRPVHLELVDESRAHRGHRGATSGGGHYRLTLVAEEFEGQGLLERHRAVNEALRDLFGERIHALSIQARAPSEAD